MTQIGLTTALTQESLKSQCTNFIICDGELIIVLHLLNGWRTVIILSDVKSLSILLNSPLLSICGATALACMFGCLNEFIVCTYR